MNLRRRVISWAGAIALVACLGAQSIVLSPDAASGRPAAAAGKKCKRKHHGKKRRCKRRMVPAPASISISPMSQDFGIPEIPDGATRTFMVTNAGGTSSGVPIPAITGANMDNFKIAANGCVAPLGPSLTCQIDVNLPPRGAGLVSATLNVTAIPGGVASSTMTGDIEA
jgi:hypothetical protein